MQKIPKHSEKRLIIKIISTNSGEKIWNPNDKICIWSNPSLAANYAFIPCYIMEAGNSIGNDYLGRKRNIDSDCVGDCRYSKTSV